MIIFSKKKSMRQNIFTLDNLKKKTYLRIKIYALNLIYTSWLYFQKKNVSKENPRIESTRVNYIFKKRSTSRNIFTLDSINSKKKGKNREKILFRLDRSHITQEKKISTKKANITHIHPNVTKRNETKRSFSIRFDLHGTRASKLIPIPRCPEWEQRIGCVRR